MPQFHSAAFADGFAAHGEQDRRLERDQAEACDDDLVAGEFHGRIYAPGFVTRLYAPLWRPLSGNKPWWGTPRDWKHDPGRGACPAQDRREHLSHRAARQRQDPAPVNRDVRELQRLGIDYAYTASTGIAATHGHGVTIHAWSGIGVREALTRRDLDLLSTNRRLASRIEKTKVLIIDEISMLPARALSLVDAVRRHIRGQQAPFGGLQVVLVGDFFQLPPVVRRDRDEFMLPLAGGADAFGAEFAHTSPAWEDLAPTVCYLSEQHRQSDAAFLDVLAAIRSNACVGPHRERLVLAADRQ